MGQRANADFVERDKSGKDLKWKGKLTKRGWRGNHERALSEQRMRLE
jgi:hypothetical protein